MKEKQSNRLKLMFCVIGIALMLITVSISTVSATSYIRGCTTPAASYTTTALNSCHAVEIIAYGASSTSYNLININAYLDCQSAHAKGVIWYSNGTLLAVSSTIAGGSGATFHEFTFSGVTLTNNTNYYFGIITDGAVKFYAGVGGHNYVGGASNVYASPTDWSAGGGASDPMALYITISDAGVTPTSTASPPSAFTDSWINNIVSLIVPLALVLIPAFLCWKFAGAWGFFAGVNIGVILCYVFGGLIPLWGVIVMLVVDGLLLFGRVGFRT